MADLMSSVDVYVLPFDDADYTPNPVATLNTAITNLTGQPCALVPHGFNEKRARGIRSSKRRSATCTCVRERPTLRFGCWTRGLALQARKKLETFWTRDRRNREVLIVSPEVRLR